MIKKLVLAAVLAGSLGTIATSASAVVYVRVAPPEPRVEVVPQPRRGHTWAAGHWEWQNRKHVWVAGNWVRDRRGHQYHQPNWAQREGDGRWYMTRGNWKRDQDGDGIPNKVDRDRDGDGVRNSQDRAPNNPNRH